MKMTEHAQSLNDSAEEVFRDGIIVERSMEVILRPYVNGGGRLFP